MLYYTMLCYAMLCYAVLCCATLRNATARRHTITPPPPPLSYWGSQLVRQSVTFCGFSSFLIVVFWDFFHWKQAVFLCLISECQWGHGGVFLWCWARGEAVCQQTSWPLGTGPRRLLELWREFAGVLWYRGTKSSIFVNQTVRLKKKT